MSSQLALTRCEAELPARVATGLRVVFETVREVTLLLADRGGRELVPATEGAHARGALAALCAGIAAIPPRLRAASRTEPLLPYLMVPALVARDPARAWGAMMSAPLLDQMRLLGLLVVEAAPDAPDFTLADLDALAAMAAQIGLVMQRLRAERRAAEQGRVERDLRIARQIQRRFLPALAPELGGLRVAAEYRPAFEVGGDFYDLVPGPDGQVTAVIGDVSGKGIAAALVMVRVSSEFRRLARDARTPEALLTQLNNAMCEQSPDDTFVTAVCLQLDPPRRRARVANAGHVLPLLRRAGGEVLPIGSASGPPLGMLPGQAYLSDEFALQAGDIVLLMTDGVVEALDSEADPFGMSGLCDLIAGAPHDPAEINRRVLAAVDRALGARLADDVTLLALAAA